MVKIKRKKLSNWTKGRGNWKGAISSPRDFWYRDCVTTSTASSQGCPIKYNFMRQSSKGMPKMRVTRM
jgi:hypothetical protein